MFTWPATEDAQVANYKAFLRIPACLRKQDQYQAQNTTFSMVVAILSVSVLLPRRQAK